MSVARYPCGTVSAHGAPNVQVFSDQVCTRCGHVPCPMCGTWCDQINVDCLCEDEMGCVYKAEPEFFTADGKPWP